MQRLIAHQQLAPGLFRQTILRQRQVMVLVPAVKFVAYDRMSNGRKVNSYLVLAPSARGQAQ